MALSLFTVFISRILFIFYDDIKVTIQQMGGAPKKEVQELIENGADLIPVTIDSEEGFVKLLEKEDYHDLNDPDLPKGWTNFYRSDDVSATAYFYLNKPTNDLPCLQPVEIRTASLPNNRMMNLDSHQHFWHYDPVKYSWLDDSMASIQKDFMPMDLEPVLRKNGFEGTILVQADQSEEETEFLLNLAEKHSFIKGVVGWVDLSSDKVGDRLKHFSRNPYFKGVRHTVWDQQGEFMTEKAFQEGISKLANFDLAYDLLVFDYQLPGAVKLVEKFPDQRFVLDHMGKPQISAEGPSKEWKTNIERLAKNSNVFCKLSGLRDRNRRF